MTHQYQKTLLISTLLFFLIVTFATNSLSQDISDNKPLTPVTPSEEVLPVLPQITVTGARIAPMTGATILDRELINNLPARNGTINDLISTVPSVQYSEDRLHSFTGGEVTPPGVSISGSRFYENNFTIDGFSNNSALDPATESTNDTSILPGHPQQIFLDPHLIDQITVYDSNIPAEHGGFTGGMVAAETLDPVDRFWGNINYRTTRDSWTDFHIHPDDQESFNNSETEEMQPKFKKYDAGFALNTPIGSDMGILTSYQRLQSDIPLLHFGTRSEQSRVSENFFLKYGYHISNQTRFYLTVIYAPFKNGYFQTSKNSSYSIEGGTRLVTTKVQQDFTGGTLELDMGYSYQKTERNAPHERFKWDTSTPSIDWANGLEGGNGPLETSQKVFELNSTFSLKDFSTGKLDHQAKIGMEVEHSKQTYNRPVTAYYYTDSSLYPAVIDQTIECNGAVACIDNEQYLLQRYVYEQATSDASYNRYAAFLQDAMVWKRLEIFPGIRISYDNNTENFNTAPRFSAAYDFFANRQSILFGGANRYYSGTLLTNKLREAISPSGIYETRADLSSDFEVSDSGVHYLWETAKLKTPYSDEITLGFIQAIFGGESKFQYIKRTGKDELAREWVPHEPDDGYRYYHLNNNGRTEHESYNLSWHRTWHYQYLEINGTYQKTNTSNLTYNNTVDTADVEELFLYNGKIVHYDELPRTDFNRPKIINLIYSGKLPLNTTFTNTTKYRGAYYYKKYLERPYLPDGTRVFSYEERKNHSAITFDWRFAWEIPLLNQQMAIVTLDIYNVFNEKAYVSSHDDEFEIGRQYWAGFEYNF